MHMHTAEEILERLQPLASSLNREGMQRFGIAVDHALGVRAPDLRRIAKGVGKDHALALALWDTGIREARLLAAWVDDPQQVSIEQMDRWAGDFDSWDICDTVCSGLFDRTPHGYAKAREWVEDEREFVKRAGFVLMAVLAVQDRKAPNTALLPFLPLLQRGATDERNLVKKAVNWALRQLGKRNLALNAAAIAIAEEIRRMDSRSARWIGSDALRELRSEAVRSRLEIREERRRKRAMRAEKNRMSA